VPPLDVWESRGLTLALRLCQKTKLKAREGPAPGGLWQRGGKPPQPPPGGGDNHEVWCPSLRAANPAAVAEGTHCCRGCAEKTRNNLWGGAGFEEELGKGIFPHIEARHPQGPVGLKEGRALVSILKSLSQAGLLAKD